MHPRGMHSGRQLYPIAASDSTPMAACSHPVCMKRAREASGAGAVARFADSGGECKIGSLSGGKAAIPVRAVARYLVI